MNKRFYMSKCLSAVLALSMMGGVMAAAGTDAGAVRVTEGIQGSTVQLHFKGADRIHIDLSGRLEIVNSDGHVWHYRPEVYQVVGGKQKRVSVRVDSIDKDRVFLQLGKTDPSAQIVVNTMGRTL